MKKVDDHERWSPRGPGDEVLLDAEYHVDDDIGRPAVLRLIPPWPGREQAHLYVEAETATGEVSLLIACSPVRARAVVCQHYSSQVHRHRRRRRLHRHPRRPLNRSSDSTFGRSALHAAGRSPAICKRCDRSERELGTMSDDRLKWCLSTVGRQFR